MGGNLSTFKPHFSDVVRAIVDTMMLDMKFCLPAKIVRYDADTQYADVQITLFEKFNDGTLKLPPVIPMVPVRHPRANGGKTRIHIPLVPGDDVTLNFSERSLDNWKSQGTSPTDQTTWGSDPADPRKNHITDAYATPGGSSIPDAFTVNDPTAVEIVNSDGVIQILPNGDVNLGSYNPGKSAAIGESVQSRLMTIENFITSFLVEYDAHVHPTAAPGPPSPPAVPADPFTPDTSVVSSETIKVTP